MHEYSHMHTYIFIHILSKYACIRAGAGYCTHISGHIPVNWNVHGCVDEHGFHPCLCSQGGRIPLIQLRMCMRCIMYHVIFTLLPTWYAISYIAIPSIQSRMCMRCIVYPAWDMHVFTPMFTL